MMIASSSFRWRLSSACQQHHTEPSHEWWQPLSRASAMLCKLAQRLASLSRWATLSSKYVVVHETHRFVVAFFIKLLNFRKIVKAIDLYIKWVHPNCMTPLSRQKFDQRRLTDTYINNRKVVSKYYKLKKYILCHTWAQMLQWCFWSWLVERSILVNLPQRMLSPNFVLVRSMSNFLVQFNSINSIRLLLH